MKIGELDQHCGNCDVIDFCGNPYGYCLCRDSDFRDVDVSKFKQMADTVTDIKPLDVCEGCTRPDCGPYKYSETDYIDDECVYADDAKDHYCEQVAEYVHRQLN